MMQSMAVDAAANALMTLAARSATHAYGRPSKRQHTESEGFSSKDVVMRVGASVASTVDRYGVHKPMDVVRRYVQGFADHSLWITNYFGKLTKSPIAYENGSPEQFLSYRLKYQEGQTIPVGPTGAPANALNATEYPLHIYSLSNRLSAGNVVGHFMYSDTNQTSTTGMMKFGCLTGLSNDGSTNTNTWTTWAASSSITPAAFGDDSIRYTVLKTVEADILLRGTLNNPVEWNIDLVSMKEDELGPDATTSLTRDQIFTNLVRGKLGNPLASYPKAAKSSQLYVHKSWSFYMPPGLTIESDKTPPQRHVRLTLDLNKLINWSWTAKQFVSTRTDVDEVNLWSPVYHEVNTAVKTAWPPNYQDRCYLIIRATNPYTNSTNSDPSYDLKLKATHVFSDTSPY